MIEVLGLMEKLEELSENVKEFMINNGNIILFVGLFAAGLAVFFIVYNAMNKEN